MRNGTGESHLLKSKKGCLKRQEEAGRAGCAAAKGIWKAQEPAASLTVQRPTRRPCGWVLHR